MHKLMQRLLLGGMSLAGTLLALPAESSQAQQYYVQPNYYGYNYAPPPPPPPVVVVPPPVVTYEHPFDRARARWARRHWLRHHFRHHHHDRHHHHRDHWGRR